MTPPISDALAEFVREIVREELDRRLAEIAPAPARPWLTVAEAAEQLGCSRDAVRMRVKRGRLEARRQGRRLYVFADSIQRLGSPMMTPNKSMAPARLTPPEARPQEAQLP